MGNARVSGDSANAPEFDRTKFDRLRREFGRPTPRALQTVIGLSLLQAFQAGLERGRVLTIPQMVRAVARQMQTKAPGDTGRARDKRQLGLLLSTVEHAYCTAARIYVDYYRQALAVERSATKGRYREIDDQRELLLREDLTHLKKAKLLGLDTGTPDQNRLAKDVIRKRIAALKKRDS